MKSNEKNEWTVRLTGILVYALGVFLLAALFLIPSLCAAFLEPTGATELYTPLCVCLYASLLPAIGALFCLHGLLCKIRNAQVFVKANVKFIRLLSYCSLGETVVYGILGLYLPFSFMIAFAALFLSLILRVLTDVFRRAVALREDNDAVI